MKKKLIAVCALALCTALCVVAAAKWPRAEASGQSTGVEPNTTNPAAPEPTSADPREAGTGTPAPVFTPGSVLPFRTRSTGFVARYIRTDGYHEDMTYPRVTVIRSAEELNEYYEANKDRFYMEGLVSACQRYDETYFADRILLIVVVEAGSGSVRYQVSDVELAGVNGDDLGVAIDVISPEMGTCDMAEWHILIEPEAGLDVKDESHVKVNLRQTTQKTQTGLAYCSCGSASAALRIPEGWTYETGRAAGPCEGGSEEDGNFFIAFRPLDRTRCIVLRHYFRNSGVCGTGLEQEQIRLGDFEGMKGTFDGHSRWDFITITDTEGRGYLFITNEAMGEWSDSEYRDGMEILATLEIGDGSPTEAQAIEIAKTAVTVPYDYTRAIYDGEHGFWTVAFGRRNYAGGDQLVTVSDGGEIVDSTWGE